MTPEERELLEKNARLAEDSNQILHSMRRSMRLSGVMRAIYWVIIIGSAVGAYYFIQPYVDQLKDAYGGASQILKGLKQ